jgi:hypothetical protein
MRALLDAMRFLEDVYDSEYGPLASWRGPWSEGMWERLDVRVWVLDDVDYEDDEVFDCADHSEFAESPLGKAGRAYRRECGWDFPPGFAGEWVAAYVPSSWSGPAVEAQDGEPAEPVDGWCSGNLVSFAVLYDRDEDGEVESLAHLWTARRYRRQGYARAVIDRARERFPIRHVEGPVTDHGWALLQTVAPDLLDAAGKA